MPMKLSKERYDKGVSSYLEVLDTERTLFSTDLQFSELQQHYRNAYVNLYKALGGGWLSKADRDQITDQNVQCYLRRSLIPGLPRELE